MSPGSTEQPAGVVETDELPTYRGKVTMVDGAFDPIHPGHIAYFREARKLGPPVLCNVAADEYVMGKHPPLLPATQRVDVLAAVRYLDLIHLSRTSTAEVLSALRPRYYVKGVDWKDRLPPDELAVCAEHGIEIAYLETVTQSSSEILERYLDRANERGSR